MNRHIAIACAVMGVFGITLLATAGTSPTPPPEAAPAVIEEAAPTPVPLPEAPIEAPILVVPSLPEAVIEDVPDLDVPDGSTPPSAAPSIPDIDVPVGQPPVRHDVPTGTLECGHHAKPATDWNELDGWWAYCEPALVDVAHPDILLIACPVEDFDAADCYWDAATMGNGQGRSFVIINGIQFISH